MGIRRGVKAAGKAAMRGASPTDIVKAGVVGAAPIGTRKIVGAIADKVVTPENLDRVRSGVKDVIDKGRSGTFSDSNPNPPMPPAPPRI